jgi:hypothetical protein
MSREEGKRGAISPGQLADLAVLTDDYFSIPGEEIKSLESVLTILGGKPVYAAEEFKPLDPSDLPVMPDWSPVHHYPGYWRWETDFIVMNAVDMSCFDGVEACVPILRVRFER